MRIGLELLWPILFGEELFPISPGPFWFIFGILPAFFREIPRLHGGRESGGGGRRHRFAFSEKSLIYLIFLQLALSSKSSSLLPSVVATLGGIIYYTVFLNTELGAKLQIPEAWMRGFLNLASPGDNSAARSLRR